jgi:AmmeMemoRadiSam system protein B
MAQPSIRPAAVAGSWYPGRPGALEADLDRYFGRTGVTLAGELIGLLAPHAGLMYSGPVAAHAYRVAAGRQFDVVVLVGPSHHVGFAGVAVESYDGWETPFGVARVDRELGLALTAATPLARRLPEAHAREHSLEMQMPFVMRVLPGVPILPVLMGHQDRATVLDVADALAAVLTGRRVLLVASSDLSHYHPAVEAARLDQAVLDRVARFDADGLLALLARRPDHACGGGPLACVMRTARALGATDARVLHYADSGDVSGDKSAVVGYAAAAFGVFDVGAPTAETSH